MDIKKVSMAGRTGGKSSFAYRYLEEQMKKISEKKKKVDVSKLAHVPMVQGVGKRPIKINASCL